MRHLILAAIAGLASPGLAADRSFPAAGFDKVDLAAAAAVDVHSGGPFAVRADGDPALIQRLDITVRNGTLVIGWLPGRALTMNHNNKLHIAITMPRISAATISGAGTLTVDRAEAPDFTATLKGAGTVRLGALRARHAQLNMIGAGQIVAAGSTGEIEAHVNGVGAIDAGQLVARGGRFVMAGTGSIKAQVDGPADVTMAGLGSVDVRGRARCTVHKSGFGSVHCGA